MIANLLSTTFGQSIATGFIATLPVVELRGALPFGIAMGLPVPLAFVLSVTGNMLPVPFIMVFIRTIFHWMRNHNAYFENVVERIEQRAHSKAELFYKYELLGLILLVAIPLPGTGAWTGALVAALLEIRLRVALPCILLGVLLAGCIVCMTVMGVIHVSV